MGGPSGLSCVPNAMGGQNHGPHTGAPPRSSQVMHQDHCPKIIDWKPALAAAVTAAREAGALMRKNWRTPKRINATHRHDLKLELDVRCQKRITTRLRRAFPDIALLGEEGVTGQAQAPTRWVVDPIDGTVNFAFEIPHACVSIALQTRPDGPRQSDEDYTSILGVVYDPFCDELWTAIRGHPARLNGRIIHASPRTRLSQTIVAIGFGKLEGNLERMLPAVANLMNRVRKIRVMGSAALELVYVASGRLDAYVEAGVRLWDIAAGGLILECAGGDFWHRPLPGNLNYRILANNGHLRRSLLRYCG